MHLRRNRRVLLCISDATGESYYASQAQQESPIMHLRRNRRWYVRSMHAWCAHPSLPTTLTPSPSRCRQAHRRRANPNPSPLTRTRTLTLTLTLTLSGAARHTAAGRHADGPRRLVSHHRNWPRGGLGLGAESRRPGAHWHWDCRSTRAARARARARSFGFFGGSVACDACTCNPRTVGLFTASVKQLSFVVD